MPGNWEFELVELKAPGSIWNPDPEGEYYLAADSETYEGRTAYVDETSGAYYASRLAVLEHLQERDRQATCLVIRHASDGYWAPVGVWRITRQVAWRSTSARCSSTPRREAWYAPAVSST